MQVQSLGWEDQRRAWQPTPLFFLENPMDRGAWQPTVHGVAKSQTQLSMLIGISVIKGALRCGVLHVPTGQCPGSFVRCK